MPERDDRVQTRRNQKAADKTATTLLPRAPSGAMRDRAAESAKSGDAKKVYSGPRTGFGKRKTNRRAETGR